MKVLQIFAIMFCLAGVFASCSKDDDNTKGQEPVTPVDPLSFSLLSLEGKILEDGQEVTALETLSEENKKITLLQTPVWVKNNTNAPIKVRMSYRVVSSDLDKIKDYFTYCWDVCYSPGQTPETSPEVTLKAKDIFKNFYGEMENVDQITSDFDVKVEYTFTDVTNGESQKVIGYFTNKKK